MQVPQMHTKCPPCRPNALTMAHPHVHRIPFLGPKHFMENQAVVISSVLNGQTKDSSGSESGEAMSEKCR